MALLRLRIKKIRLNLTLDADGMASPLHFLTKAIDALRAQPNGAEAAVDPSGPAGETPLGCPSTISRYEHDTEDPDPEEPETTESAPAHAAPVDTVPVDHAEHNETPPREKDMATAITGEVFSAGKTFPANIRRAHPAKAHANDRHHEQVAGAPKIQLKDRVLRLIAERPLSREHIMEAMEDRELCVTGGARYKMLRDLRRDGFTDEVLHEGSPVMALTERGKERIRRCPSSEE